MKWLFFEIDPPHKGEKRPQRFSEMEEVSPEEALAAVAHSARHGGCIELYLTGDDHVGPDDRGDGLGGTPYIGLIFRDGRFVGSGLGGPETQALYKLMVDDLGMSGAPFAEVRQDLYNILVDVALYVCQVRPTVVIVSATEMA